MKTEDFLLASMLMASLPRVGEKKRKTVQKSKKCIARIKKEKLAKKARKNQRK